MIRRTTTTRPTKAVTGKNPVTGTKRVAKKFGETAVSPKGKDEISPELLAAINSSPGGGLSDDIIDNAFYLSDDSNLDPPPGAGPPPAKIRKAKKYAVNLSAEEWPWVQALDRLDRHGDEGPLQNLLKNYKPPSPRIERYLVDLTERKKARKGKSSGRPKTPAYRLSDIDALLLIACESVRGYVQRGMRVKAALEKVKEEFLFRGKDGRDFPFSIDRLDDAYNNRRASLRKSKKRL
jgi:hypothetical protein